MRAFVARIKAELQLQRADFDDFNKGEWITVFGSSSNRICMKNPILYHIYEILSALFLTGLWIWSYADGCGVTWFAFLTHWSLTLQTVYSWFDFFTTLMANGMSSGRFERVESIPLYAQVTWFLFGLMVPTTFLVFVLYFALLVDWNDPPTAVLSYLTHGANFVVMMADTILSNKPYYLLHGIYFFLFAAVYAVFTYIYYLFDGTNCEGDPYIYSVLNWGDNFASARRLSGIILVVVAPVINFLFWIVISFWFPGLRPKPGAQEAPAADANV